MTIDMREDELPTFPTVLGTFSEQNAIYRPIGIGHPLPTGTITGFFYILLVALLVKFFSFFFILLVNRKDDRSRDQEYSRPSGKYKQDKVERTKFSLLCRNLSSTVQWMVSV